MITTTQISYDGGIATPDEPENPCVATETGGSPPSLPGGMGNLMMVAKSEALKPEEK